MGILDIFTGGMSTVYKWAAVALVVSIIAGVAGYKGYSIGKAESAVAIAQFSQKYNQLASQLQETQVTIVDKITTQYVDRIIKVKETEVHNEQIAQNVVPDHEYFSVGWVYVHDSAANGVEADTTIAADDTPSTTTANSALAVIVSNYAACKANAEELSSLQDWIVQTNKSIDAQNEAIKKSHGRT